MSFDLYQFFRTNKKFVIWVAFFGLLFLVRKVFGLLFLTFILCYIFNNAILRLERRLGMNRHFWTVFVYLLDCLYAERKDRSILFWKSLPASDTLTIASKLLAAMVLACGNALQA